MGDKSNIEWTDATWNPVTGCTKVSAGCKHCYAERWISRCFDKSLDRKFTDVRCHPERLDKPLRWRKPRRVFVNSMSDLFHENVPDDFIDRVFAVMALAPQHTFQVLTKRPERMQAYMTQDEGFGRWGYIEGRARQLAKIPPGKTLIGPLANIWLGVSCEDQATADERIPLLLQTPSAVRFVSCEPLLGPIDLDRLQAPYEDRPLHFSAINEQHDDCYYNSPSQLDWIIAGGESGPHARPMHPDWARSLRDQCQAAGVPFFFKQWGEWVGTRPEDAKPPAGVKCREWSGGICSWRVGKRTAGRLLDGQIHDGYPT